MEDETKVSVVPIEIPHDPTDEEFINKIKSLVNEGKQAEMLSADPDRSLPFSFGMVMSVLSYDANFKYGINISKRDLTNRSSHWKLTISPVTSEVK